MKVQFPKSWLEFTGLKAEDIPVIDECAYPPVEMRYRALEYVAPEDVRVIILGQDPYHGAGEAHGLAFSVPRGIKMPPSLRNIFTELADDLDIPKPLDTDLTRWASQGVLLLNTSLTVAPDQPGSHANKGWKEVTDAIIRALGAAEGPSRVFVLWGKPAQTKRALIAEGKHLVIEAPHPSPLSAYRGFFGSRPFSKINDWLRVQGSPVIDWQ